MTSQVKQEPEKLDMASEDIAAERRAELVRLFPEARTEGGKIDFDQLKRTLGDAVDAGKERYGLVWPGKADCFKTIQAPSLATLRPAPEESVNFDTTENLIIEGDNLEVLKLLQKSYLGKVKMIYIDPPYNTGNDFIYPDNYSESLETYLEYTGQVDAEGRKFGTNTEADGRFHSKWLNMMYPRLYLARNFLRDDGVIAISIDDSEHASLRLICNELFGEDNFIASLVWEKGRKNDAKFVSVGHEYIVLYVKNKLALTEKGVIWREAKPGALEIYQQYQKLRTQFGADNRAIESALRKFYDDLPKGHPSKKHARYSHVDDKGVWRDDNMSWPGSGGPDYEVLHPVTKKPCKVPDGGWRYSTPEKMQEMIETGKVVFRSDHTEPPIRKTYLVRGEDGEENNGDDEGDIGIQVAGSYFYRSGLQASNELTKLLGKKVFENPKDHEVLSRWIAYVGSEPKDDIVLDFFGGSGSTAQAVLEQNAKDGGSRKFIVVQLPEPTRRAKPNGAWDETPASRAGFSTIAEILKERVRRVIKKLRTDLDGQLGLSARRPSDLGFRSFKLAESNFKVWDASAAKDTQQLEKQLALNVGHLREGRKAPDFLYEILLKSGFPLTAQVEKLTLCGKQVFSVAAGALLVCLERELTLDLIRAIADRKPERVVCLDEGFAGNDQLKTNAVQTFKTKGVVFRTV